MLIQNNALFTISQGTSFNIVPENIRIHNLLNYNNVVDLLCCFGCGYVGWRACLRFKTGQIRWIRHFIMCKHFVNVSSFKLQTKFEFEFEWEIMKYLLGSFLKWPIKRGMNSKSVPYFFFFLLFIIIVCKSEWVERG